MLRSAARRVGTRPWVASLRAPSGLTPRWVVSRYYDRMPPHTVASKSLKVDRLSGRRFGPCALVGSASVVHPRCHRLGGRARWRRMLLPWSPGETWPAHRKKRGPSKSPVFGMHAAPDSTGRTTTAKHLAYSCSWLHVALEEWTRLLRPPPPRGLTYDSGCTVERGTGPVGDSPARASSSRLRRTQLRLPRQPVIRKCGTTRWSSESTHARRGDSSLKTTCP